MMMKEARMRVRVRVVAIGSKDVRMEVECMAAAGLTVARDEEGSARWDAAAGEDVGAPEGAARTSEHGAPKGAAHADVAGWVWSLSIDIPPPRSSGSVKSLLSK